MNSNSSSIYTFLLSKSPVFKSLISRYGFLKLIRNDNIYESLIFHFIRQVLSNKVGEVLTNRLINLVGSISPSNIDKISTEEIKSLGIASKKAEYIKNLTTLYLEGKINLSLEFLDSLTDEEILKYLTSIKGIGEWTAEMIMAFSLGRENVFSWNDIALKRGIMKVHKEFKTLSRTRFERLRKLYSPYCSYAALYYYKVNDSLDYK